MAEIIDVYREFLTESGLDVPFLKDHIQTGLTPFLRLAGDRLADNIQKHYHGNVSELVIRISEHNMDWACTAEGRAIIEDLDNEGKSISGKNDPISVFWILNSHLPKSHQFTFLPEGGYRDKFFTITEEALLTVILRAGNTDNKEFLRNVFKTQPEEREMAAEHPGDLIYRLFMSKNLDYHRGLFLANPGPNLPKGLALLDTDDDAFAEYQGVSEGSSSTSNVAANLYGDAKELLKKYVKAQLNDPISQKQAIDEGTEARKRVLRGSISTNGYELHVLAYCLTQAAPSPSARKRPNTTRNRLPDVKSVLNEKDPEEIFGNGKQVVVGIDPGILNTATCCILSSDDMMHPKNLTIPRSSRTFTLNKFQSGLENAKKKANLSEQERQIVPVECPMAVEGQQYEAWTSLWLSVEEHVKSVIQVQRTLRSFYSSSMFKVKTFQRKQALKAIKQKGVDRLISASGCNGKVKDGSVRPLFVVGDAEFESLGGHKEFIAMLQKRVGTEASLRQFVSQLSNLILTTSVPGNRPKAWDAMWRMGTNGERL